MCCIKNNTKSNGITDFNNNETCNSIINIDTGENYHQKCYAIHNNILHRENADYYLVYKQYIYKQYINIPAE